MPRHSGRTGSGTLPVTTFLISTVFLSIVLPCLAVAGASPAVVGYEPLDSARRHEMHDAHADASSSENDADLSEVMTHAISAADDMAMSMSMSMSATSTASPASASASAEAATTSSPETHAHAHAQASQSPETHEHGHDHGTHAVAKTELDDVHIHQIHHFPPTYLDADFRLDTDSAIFGEEFDESWNKDEVEGHKGLMGLYVVGMSVAYFAVLPIALALRAADHPAHYVVNGVFLIIAILGWMAGVAYRSASVDRYEGAVHWSLASGLLLLSISLAVIDSIGLIKRSISFYRQHDWSFSSFLHDVLQQRSESKWAASRYEMVGLVEDEEDQHQGGVVFSIGEDEDADDESDYRTHQDSHHRPQRPSLLTRQWTPPSRASTGSEGTLQDVDTPSTSASTHAFAFGHKLHHQGLYNADKHAHFDHVHENHHLHEDGQQEQVNNNEPLWKAPQSKGVKRAVEIVLTWIRRSQVILAYVVFLSGITMYTGMCRAGLINSCAAHYIKGSIFFFYGLLTFGRYLGAYADLGWAWNRRPGGDGISAEMIECAVIFTYGITNTWMERFGSGPDAPYTVKQVQHISIAVMFWFAGLSGMLLESRWVRKLLGSVISSGKRDVQEPPSYLSSFNPLPALVIGVTGLAMAAHHQEYVFQVQIHSLWGTLLAGGSLFRFLTYFFLFLRPPTESELPSRPPTEVLTSFGYAAGGIVFMLSNEEIAWAAMRAGWDDMMAFLNFTVALTSLIFCWGVVVMAVKGWAVLRLARTKGTHVESA